ncbi:MAG: heme o synthase [Methylococcales bacterium]
MISATTLSPPAWKCYLDLCKPNVVAEMLFTAVVGMLLAVPGLPPVDKMLFGSIGIGLAAASAAAINHYIDRNIDEDLWFNVDRPLPKNYLTPQQVITFALVLGVIAMLVLIALVNLLTAALTFVSLFGYAVIYTHYLKRLTSQGIVVGGIFGATPPLLGWCAVTGEVHPYSLLLALIIFVWTPPHFWPLAIVRIEGYKVAFEKYGIRMLPVTHGIAHTRLQILLYSVLLLIVTLLPYLTGMSGLIYLGTVIPLGLGFIYFAVSMMRTGDKKTARQTFWYSIVYITLLFAALLIDHYFKFTL